MTNKELFAKGKRDGRWGFPPSNKCVAYNAGYLQGKLATYGKTSADKTTSREIIKDAIARGWY